jgi:hypothetical protein
MPRQDDPDSADYRVRVVRAMEDLAMQLDLLRQEIRDTRAEVKKLATHVAPLVRAAGAGNMLANLGKMFGRG